MTTFKQFFTDAYEAQQKSEAEAREQRIRDLAVKTMLAFERLTGEILKGKLVTDGNIVTLDGLILRYMSPWSSNSSWQVKGNCPLCGRECWSNHCYNKENIGAQLASFSPNGEHVCGNVVSVSTESTWQARLVSALADAIAELRYE